MIEELIQNVLADTQRLTLEQADVVGLENIDESTFRSFFLLVFYERCPEAMCQTEWKDKTTDDKGRLDLLIQVFGLNVLIEIKFFVYRYQWNIERTKRFPKGGPSPKNVGEMEDDIRDLHKNQSSPIHSKYLIIAYDPTPSGKKNSYSASYDSIEAASPVKSVYRVPRNPSDKLSIAMLTIE